MHYITNRIPKGDSDRSVILGPISLRQWHPKDEADPQLFPSQRTHESHDVWSGGIWTRERGCETASWSNPRLSIWSIYLPSCVYSILLSRYSTPFLSLLSSLSRVCFLYIWYVQKSNLLIYISANVLMYLSNYWLVGSSIFLFDELFVC